MPYVTDTHSLVWFMTDNPELSTAARNIFQAADDCRESIYIPCIVLFELVYLVEKKKIEASFEFFLHSLESSENYKIEPLCLPIINRSREIPRERVADPWDRLIVATALHLDIPLITRDRTLHNLGINIVAS